MLLTEATSLPKGPVRGDINMYQQELDLEMSLARSMHELEIGNRLDAVYKLFAARQNLEASDLSEDAFDIVMRTTNDLLNGGLPLHLMESMDHCLEKLDSGEITGEEASLLSTVQARSAKEASETLVGKVLGTRSDGDWSSTTLIKAAKVLVLIYYNTQISKLECSVLIELLKVMVTKMKANESDYSLRDAVYVLLLCMTTALHPASDRALLGRDTEADRRRNYERERPGNARVLEWRDDPGPGRVMSKSMRGRFSGSEFHGQRSSLNATCRLHADRQRQRQVGDAACCRSYATTLYRRLLERPGYVMTTCGVFLHHHGIPYVILCKPHLRGWIAGTAQRQLSLDRLKERHVGLIQRRLEA